MTLTEKAKARRVRGGEMSDNGNGANSEGIAVKLNSENGTTPLLISVTEAAKLLSIGRNTAYDLIAAGRLPSVKLGRRRLVSVAALTAWIARECGVASPPDSVVPFEAGERKE